MRRAKKAALTELYAALDARAAAHQQTCPRCTCGKEADATTGLCIQAEMTGRCLSPRAADDALQAALVRQHGKAAGDARYRAPATPEIAALMAAKKAADAAL